MQKVILHLDMNSYFASVEQQANPFLRGKPVGVCATLTSHGCILASSKEAKAFGIKTGCRVDEALQRCPDIRLVEVDPPKYRSTTERIFKICAEYTEDLEPYSIDEAFLNLTGTVPTLAAAEKIGQEIKTRIVEEVGEWLKCSMGVAPTRWLAKFAGDTAPKGGLVILHKENLSEYLRGRDVEEAWGIAGATAARLARIGITTLDQLQQASPVNLMEVFGIRGYELWANLNAVELNGVQEEGAPKSIGHSHVLRKRTRDLRFHQALIMRLCERTGRRLRTLGLEAHGVYAYASMERTGGLGTAHKLGTGIADTLQIYKHVWSILGPGVTTDLPTFYALGLFRLGPQTHQLSLFTKPKSHALSQAVDELNDRYGEETVVFGQLVKLPDLHAPDRIGFRKTVSWR
jgi:DNA polymerase-4